PAASSTFITRQKTSRVARYSHRIERARTPKFVSMHDSSPEPTGTNPAYGAAASSQASAWWSVDRRRQDPALTTSPSAASHPSTKPAMYSTSPVSGSERFRFTGARTTPVPAYPGWTSRQDEKFTWSKKSANFATRGP